MSTPLNDPQSRAFREAGPGDRWDGDLAALEATAQGWAHPPASRAADLVLPQTYERGAGWDEHRDGPKSLQQAQQALQARINNPHAPDTQIEADAYSDHGRPS